MKQKKSPQSLTYQQVYNNMIQQHKQNMDKAGYPVILEQQFNRDDRTQEFYKTFERQFRNSLTMKHGYKIASLQIQEEDLALYCFSLLQAEANFPIKIFTINHDTKANILDPEQPSRKDLWMQTYIMVASLITSSKDEHLFEAKIHNFFNNYLLKNLREFMRKKINWDYMTSNEYSDEKVITDFQQEIIVPANKFFAKLFN